MPYKLHGFQQNSEIAPGTTYKAGFTLRVELDQASTAN